MRTFPNKESKNMSKVIRLPISGIVVTLGEPDPERQGCSLGGTITSKLKVTADDRDPEDAHAWNAAVDVLESLVLAHACAGLDITTPAYLEGIESALDAINDNI
jgi:hypothetical protein